MSWEDEDADWEAPAAGGDSAPTLTDKWDGEDEDDDCLLGDDWDADPDEKKDEKKTATPAVAKKLTKRQIAKKKEEEERSARAAAANTKEELDPEAEAKRKAEERRRIEQSNLKLVGDLFGGDGYEAPENGEFQNDQLDADNTDMIADVSVKELQKMKIEKKGDNLADVELKTTPDYKKFATKVAEVVCKQGKNKMTIEFTKQFLIDCTKKLKLDEANEIKKAITVICTQKQKDEAGKKKKGNNKKQLKMASNDDWGDDGGYDDGMDDFL